MSDLFDKFKQGVEKGISAVNLKSKEVVNSLKIKKDIESLQRQIDTAITEMGETVYTMTTLQNFEPEPIHEKCAEISLLKDQLTEKEKELDQIRIETGEAWGKTYCNQCQTELTETARYCPNCGAKVNQVN